MEQAGFSRLFFALEIGFVWLCIGFVLGSFCKRSPFDFFSYSFVNTLFMFILAFLSLGSFWVRLGSFWVRFS